MVELFILPFPLEVALVHAHGPCEWLAQHHLLAEAFEQPTRIAVSTWGNEHL